MKRKLISTFVVLFTMVYGATASTTLWEGTDDGSDIFIAKEKLVAGATITLEFNWLGSDGAQFSCIYWDGNAWKNIYNWQWVNNGETFSFSLTQDQIDAIPEQLGFKTEAVKKMTFKKISIDATLVTEWEGTDDGSDIFVAKEKLVAGAPITLEFNWLVSDGAQFSCFYWDGNAWKKIYDWQWVNNGKTFSFWLTQDQIDAIPEQLGFKTEAKDKMTFKKISIFKPCVSVTIGEDGIATFSSDKKLDFSGTGITPYYVSAVENGTVTLTKAINACTWDYCGYIIRGNEGAYDVPVTIFASYPSATYLQGTNNYERDLPQTGEEDKYIYIFAKDGNDIGFYYLNGESYTLSAHRAYLLTDSDIRPASGARVALNFDDSDPTAVVSVGESKQDNVYYNLNGMRVTNPSKGVYVVNGKKVIIK